MPQNFPHDVQGFLLPAQSEFVIAELMLNGAYVAVARGDLWVVGPQYSLEDTDRLLVHGQSVVRLAYLWSGLLAIK